MVDMLERIHAGGIKPQDCIRMAKDKSADLKLSGFGHRVYKTLDPRAKVLKGACDKVLAQLKSNDPLLATAREVEELALKGP